MLSWFSLPGALAAVAGLVAGAASADARRAGRPTGRRARYVAAGSFTRALRAGANRVAFTGVAFTRRVEGGRLKPGRYRLRAVARTATAASPVRQATFRIRG
jgi:hypothetical protein